MYIRNNSKKLESAILKTLTLYKKEKKKTWSTLIIITIQPVPFSSTMKMMKKIHWQNLFMTIRRPSQKKNCSRMTKTWDVHKHSLLRLYENVGGWYLWNSQAMTFLPGMHLIWESKAKPSTMVQPKTGQHGNVSKVYLLFYFLLSGYDRFTRLGYMCFISSLD